MARDAEVEVHLVVIRRDVRVGDRPVLAVAVVALRLEVEVGEPEGEASPDVALAAQAARAHPGVLRARVRVVLLVHHDVLAVVGARPALHVRVDVFRLRSLRVGRLADRVLVEGERLAVGRHVAAPRMVVGPLHRAQLLRGVELAPGLEQQHLEPARGEHVGGGAAGRAGADDHRVVHDREVGFLLGRAADLQEGHGPECIRGRHDPQARSGTRASVPGRAGRRGSRRIQRAVIAGERTCAAARVSGRGRARAWRRPGWPAPRAPSRRARRARPRRAAGPPTAGRPPRTRRRGPCGRSPRSTMDAVRRPKRRRGSASARGRRPQSPAGTS